MKTALRSMLFVSIASLSCNREGREVNRPVPVTPASFSFIEEDSLKTWFIENATPEECYTLWYKHLREMKNLGWTPEQHAAIDGLIGYLNPDMFRSPDFDSSARLDAYVFLDQWLADNSVIFELSDLYHLIGQPYVGSPGGGGSITVRCDCSKKSDYCGWPVGGDTECDKSCEVTSNRGCGGFWLYPCDGACL